MLNGDFGARPGGLMIELTDALSHFLRSLGIIGTHNKRHNVPPWP